MKTLPIILLVIFILGSCAEETTKKPVDESFAGFGILGYREEMNVGDNRYMEIPSFNYFVFLYHDTIFHVEIDTLGKSACYWMDYNPKGRRLADSLFTLMKKGVGLCPLNEYAGNCAPPIIYLENSEKGSQFGARYFENQILFLISGKDAKRKRLSKPPSVFASKIHEFDSRYLRHYFSEDHYYKDIRVYQYME